jgi:outer membrane protein OmpA-like peptidoglycan-associated protein
VAGDEIIFDDSMQGEQLGEFPSQWDLIKGTAEIVSFGGVKGINFETDAAVAPLMKDMSNYLPDVFTIEFDFWYEKNGRTAPYNLYLYDGRDEKLRFVFGNDPIWNYRTPADESRKGEGTYTYTDKAWNHFSLSFNKRALKVYLNGVRVTNIPGMATSKHLQLSAEGNNEGFKKGITNFRIAKGAVPLYDRMMSDGKFITYGITFDVGKSVIKPESYGELNRIVTLMQENSNLKFSVEGHTDNTGNAASNQTLSDARSKAVVDKLVELGVAKDRLQSAGKGQNSPIADNGTDEGRAKNRRVEFVQIK